MMVAFFQIAGMRLVVKERLYMSVSACIAFGPRCFRWMFEILSGPQALEFGAFVISDVTLEVVKGGEKVGGSFGKQRRLRIMILLALQVRLWLMDA